ncbi:arylesterase [Kiloniella laminariae]|uniref:Arylesterase n=1 Tax=Kiloniella laminariae TaxID=454162 RepID=A0ABT4LIW9_9PROT|nr:arylesterase [Kiloniella laminariae]MCZ4281043.1 arylesterase [Kiloniella laminariae]
MQKISRVFSLFFLLASLLLTAGFRPAIADTPLKLLAYGDSLTHGYGLEAGDTFPERLQAVLDAAGYSVEVINGGNSGDTSASGLARLEWALMDEPDLVIVELGANDGLRGLEPAETKKNLRTILVGLKQFGARVLLAGMQAPRNLGSEYVEEFDRIYPDLARETGVELYPFFLEGVAMERDLNQKDGIHPNRAGVDKIVAAILPYIESMIAAEKGS